MESYTSMKYFKRQSAMSGLGHFFIELVVQFAWLEKILRGWSEVVNFHRIAASPIIQ